MKKCFTFLLWSFGALSVFAQVAQETPPKLSPLTRHYLSEMGKSERLPEGYIYKTGINGEMYVSALVKTTDPVVAESALKVMGVMIGTKAGNIWTVQVPVDKVAEFTVVSGVAYIQLDEPVFPNLSVARKTTRVDSVHAGIGLPMAYSGKDVVAGIIDFGFDYNHPTLYDTNGNVYRVKRVWELNTNGTPPAGYAYGHERTDTNDIKAQGTDNPAQTHGTGVCGIAAGSGYGGVPNDRFRGMAYEADLVFVGVRRDSIGDQWMQSGFSDFVDGIQYIFDYANSVGKPAVVNISWGSQSGPHDGTTLFNQACDNLSGPGKIIVMSAGNDGQDRIHLTKTFTPADTVLSTCLRFNPTHYKRTWVDVWGEPGKTFCGEVTLYSQGNAGSTTGTICIDDLTHDFILLGANGLDTCWVEFITTASEFNGKPRIIMNIYNKATDTINVKVKSNDGTIHAWDEYYYYGYANGFQSEFRDMGLPGAVSGNTASTVSDMGAAQSVLLVGAYASKVNYVDINGNAWSYSGYVLANKLVPFSSRGPMVDGRIKPDITAPGLTLATAWSSYDTDYTPNGANSTSVIAEYVEPVSGNKYYYGEFSGTSASAPAASGIVALLLQEKPTLTPQEVQDIIRITAITDGHTGTIPPAGNNNWGHGKINAYGAMKYLIDPFTGLANPIGMDAACILYPNPNNGFFQIDYTTVKPGELNVEVLSITGKKLTERSWNAYTGINQYQLDLSTFPKGVYLVRMRSSEGFTTIKTVIE